jgi:hypothetical protein
MSSWNLLEYQMVDCNLANSELTIVYVTNRGWI